MITHVTVASKFQLLNVEILELVDKFVQAREIVLNKKEYSKINKHILKS